MGRVDPVQVYATFPHERVLLKQSHSSVTSGREVVFLVRGRRVAERHGRVGLLLLGAEHNADVCVLVDGRVVQHGGARMQTSAGRVLERAVRFASEVEDRCKPWLVKLEANAGCTRRNAQPYTAALSFGLHTNASRWRRRQCRGEWRECRGRKHTHHCFRSQTYRATSISRLRKQLYSNTLQFGK